MPRQIAETEWRDRMTYANHNDIVARRPDGLVYRWFEFPFF